MRDSDRAKVYSAEQEVRKLLDTPGTLIHMLGTSIVIPDERKFGRVEDIQIYVDKVLAHVGHDKPCAVRRRKGNKAAHYARSLQEIAIPDFDNWAMREIVVLHELAHHMTVGAEQSHGSEFRSMFCELIEQVLAPEARFLLQMAFFDRQLTA